MPRLILPYPPTVNTYWRNVVVGGQARVLISKAGREYREAAHARLAGIQKLEGPVSVAIDFFRPRRVGDLDNLLKSTLDALSGFAYEDDAQVARLMLERFDDKANPRAELLIEPYAPRNPATLLF